MAALFLSSAACALALSNAAAGGNGDLPSGGRGILKTAWPILPAAVPKGADFSKSRVKGSGFDAALRVVTKQMITSRKPDNYPLALPLLDVKPGETVVLSFQCRGWPADPKVEAFHSPPRISVSIRYNGVVLLDSRGRGRVELFPFWNGFKISVGVPGPGKKAVGAVKSRGRRGKRVPMGLEIVLYFGNEPEKVEIGGLSAIAFPAGKLSADAFVPPVAEGNSLIVFQNHSKTIDVLWNDTHPLKRPLHVSAVRQPKFGTVTFKGKTVTYKSTKPHELGYDYFHYTVSDDMGNTATAPVKVIVAPDFLDGTWNIGHDFKTFPRDLATDNGTPVALRRFIHPTAMTVSIARVVKLLEQREKAGKLEAPLKLTVFPFAKKGPNGEDTEPFGVYWDLPHEIDSTFCLPIMDTIGNVVNGSFKGPRTHQLRSFRMRFSVKQRCINTDDRKVRFFFKTNDGPGDVGIEYLMFDPGNPGKIFPHRKGAGVTVEIGGRLYRASKRQADITSKDTDGDGYPDQWFAPGGEPMKSRWGGGRIAAPVKDIENVFVDFDMKKYFDWCEVHGWKGGGRIAYLFNGSEMGSERASGGRMKGAGIMMFENVDYWMSTDIPPKHKLPDMKIRADGTAIEIRVSNVFDRIYPKGLDGSIPKLEYSVEKVSPQGTVDARIKKSALILKALKRSGKAEVTIKATDKYWHWDDIETFRVEIVDASKLDNDGDGLTDADEMAKYKTNPAFPDSDFDGLSDSKEIRSTKTDPLAFDTDGDGLADGAELKHGTNPRVADTDRDGLPDGKEVMEEHSNPLVKDTDKDGISDGAEAARGMDPTKRYAPIAKYAFDAIENRKFRDASGNGRDLAVHKRQRVEQKGLKGKAMLCDGAHVAEFRSTAKEDNERAAEHRGFTLSIWVKPQGKSKGVFFNAPLFSLRSDGDHYIYRGSAPKGTPPRWAGRGPHTLPPAPVSRPFAPLRPNKWTHIAVTSNGTDTRIYVDGKLRSTISKVADGVFTSFQIGGEPGRRGVKWRGLVDELFIDSRPLSPSEIGRLAKPGR